MANIYNYTFDNLSRLGDDSCYVSERTKQNNAFGNYSIQNYFINDCGLRRPIDFATNQPNVFVNGGAGHIGAGGCNVNTDSELRIGSIQTHPKCKISLYTRPFVTVPYLGKGPYAPVEEAMLQQGEYIQNIKSCNTTTEMTHMNHRHYPLIPSLQSTVTNPHNLVEGVAAKGWIRGGVPSRELVRDTTKHQ
jgi:hypothetical protein